MTLPDIINGSFELGAGLLIWLNVRRLLRDRCVRGVAILPTTLFMLWGYWNLYYYPHLGHWWSMLAGIAVVIANTTWVVLMIRYRHR